MYSASDNICPCGSDDIREDPREGLTKCTNCGRVIDDNLISWQEERTSEPRANFVSSDDDLYIPSLDAFKASSSSSSAFLSSSAMFNKTTLFGNQID
jgi:transcription initiation factor TFIIIB Brf1 subunit/transcription initiation factor TFIIB